VAPRDDTGTTAQRVVREAAAPDKPALGAPCNGCGICCLAEPCPVGMLVTRRRRGACALLRWRAEQGRYVCALLEPRPHVPWWRRPGRALLRRWLAIDRGCDSDASVSVDLGPPASK